MHDPGGEHLMGDKKGWIVHTEGIGLEKTGGKDYTPWSNQGISNIVRLNYGYYAQGTLPYQDKYDAYAERVADYVKNSPGVNYWIIGNETNLPREWPGNTTGDTYTGQPISPVDYVNAYNKCYDAIKAVAPDAKVCPAPVGTWAPYYPWHDVSPFDEYWVRTLKGIGAGRIDGLPIHAYTHGADVWRVTSDEKMQGDVYKDRIYYDFRVYKNMMEIIPEDMKDIPVFITEADQGSESADPNTNPKDAWRNKNEGWMKAVYKEIDEWNQANDHKIRCVAMFRWPAEVEGEVTYGLEHMDKLHEDYQEAVEFGYTWREIPEPTTLMLLGIGGLMMMKRRS
ncbi:PEP-CTERM sorting domain-containing protein [Planctomycetota bacterium]|nr:PEP-CTERM sorting domain-containing protein [Planctomycetota bacterium]